jgi:hypothetical protein
LQQELPFLAAGGILCFTPLTLYLFWLASVNRGDRPVVVSGTWDFVGLLCGIGGFILCAGLMLSLTATNANVFRRGGFADLQNAWANAQLAGAVTPIAYLLLIGGSAYLTLRARRNHLTVYNIHAPAADEVVGRALGRLGFDAQRTGNLWRDEKPLVETSAFPVFSHLTIKLLLADPRLREELERELRSNLPRISAGENPAAPWLTTAAVSCFITTACCVVLTFVAAYRR